MLSDLWGCGHARKMKKAKNMQRGEVARVTVDKQRGLFAVGSMKTLHCAEEGKGGSWIEGFDAVGIQHTPTARAHGKVDTPDRKNGEPDFIFSDADAERVKLLRR